MITNTGNNNTSIQNLNPNENLSSPLITEGQENPGRAISEEKNIIPKVTAAIAAVCITTYAWSIFSDSHINTLTLYSLNIPKILNGQMLRVITYPFLHGGFIHLATNMKTLSVVGPIFEKRYGATGFLKLAALSVTLHILAKVVFNNYAASVGFSGILCGMLATIHLIKRGNEFSFNLNSFTSFLCNNIAFGLLMEILPIMRIDHLGHGSGYLAGLIFVCLSK